MTRRLESLAIPGPAGQLEALLEEPEECDAREAALVCHPHPQHGGTMHNKVVYRLARGLRRSGCVVLRFNFRGVQGSQGSWAHGLGEMEDARAALAWLRDRYPGLPCALAGFSFGARVALRLGCQGGDSSRVIAAGFPTGQLEVASFNGCPLSKVFVQSTNDEYGPRGEMERFFHALDEPKRLIWIEAPDHFFAGALEDVERVVFETGATY